MSSFLQNITAEPETVAARAIEAPDHIPQLLAALSDPKPAVRYKCEKILRIVGGIKPELLYPHFDFFLSMLDCENSFLKWGAIRTVANMARVDVRNRFEAIFDKYFSPVPGPVMITTANTIGGAAVIALAKPGLAGRIAREILKVEKARYKTAECRNVAIGHAIDSFDRFYEHIPDKPRILRFVRRQLTNPRPAVRKRAETFLKRRGESK
jgi:hypothetical protein